MAEKKWFKGDTHLHTINSDGVLTKGQLVDRCKQSGLDFMIITDHNFNSVEKSYYDGDMLVIQGQEITVDAGHVNIWGAKVPQEPPYDITTKEDYAEIIKKCKDAGATISLNHPFCSQCGFTIDIENLYCDCVEVWNTIQHTDNMINRDWWVNKLLNGEKIAAVGGSDYHKNYAGLDILAHPTTYVLAEDNTPSAILEAMREGHCFVTNSPKSTEIYLTCGDANVGDTVKFEKGTTVDIAVIKLQPRHTVRVYNNEKEIYTHRANCFENALYFQCEVQEKGFVRVEITYEFQGPVKALYKAVEKKFLKCNKEVMPPFMRAFTNPIYFE